MASEIYAQLLREIARIIDEFGETEALRLILDFRMRLIAARAPTALADDRSLSYRPPTDEEIEIVLQDMRKQSNWQGAYKVLFDRHFSRPDIVRVARAAKAHTAKSDDIGKIMKNISKIVTKRIMQ